MMPLPSNLHVLRLHPHQDLRQSIEDYCIKEQISSACVVTCVGSLSQCSLRMAGANSIKELSGPFEIVSLVGVIANQDGHFHCCLSDSQGQVIGGHLCKGSLIFTTAEIVLQDLHPIQLTREFDPETGYPELMVLPQK